MSETINKQVIGNQVTVINLTSALRKKQRRLEQYSRRNKIEVTDIPTKIPENELARKFEICRESVLVENVARAIVLPRMSVMKLKKSVGVSVLISKHLFFIILFGKEYRVCKLSSKHVAE